MDKKVRINFDPLDSRQFIIAVKKLADSLTYGADLINSLNMISPADIIDNRDSWVEMWNAKVIK